MEVVRQSKRKPRACHRSWAARSAPAPGTHSGDIMSPEKRSALMSRIHSKNTTPERTICNALRRRGLHFSTHAKDLPGRPDIVFRRIKLAVFIDGDFWHGWRFPLWRHKLSPKWQDKIAANRERDNRNFRKLRRLGWKVLRLWEHQIESCSDDCVERVCQARTSTMERRAQM